MTEQRRIQRPVAQRAREETAPAELPQNGDLKAAEGDLDAIDRLLAEDGTLPDNDGAARLIEAPKEKPAVRAAADEEFVRAFRQPTGE